MTEGTSGRAWNGGALLCGVLLLISVVWQLHNGWLVGGGTLDDPDSPAHFVSGVMVHDYLWQAAGSSPMAFAESYYVRYPKVAIGHWPPVFYAIQAVWYSLVGVGTFNARALSALIVALLTISMFRAARRDYGLASALGAAAVFLAARPVVWYTWDVMSDILTAAFVWLMLRASVPLLDGAPRASRGASGNSSRDASDGRRSDASGRSPWRAAAAFTIAGALGVLTKGTAWALGPWLLIAPILARRIGVFRSLPAWAAAAMTVILGAPFYLLMRASGNGYPIDPAALATAGTGSGFGLMVRFAFIEPVKFLAPALVLVMAAIGAIDAIHARWRRGDETRAVTFALVCAAFFAAQVVFFFLLPLSADVRAWLPSLPPIMLLTARAVALIERKCLAAALFASPAGARTWTRLAVFAAPALFLAMTAFEFSDRPRLSVIDGYRAAAAAIPYRSEGSVIVIAADARGEGGFIAERLIGDAPRAGVVLRGSRIIADANWSGTIVQPRVADEQAVRERLIAEHARYVVVDSSATDDDEWVMLARAVESDPDMFRPIGRFAVSDRAGRRSGELTIYENPAALRPRETHVRLSIEHSSRTLVYRWPSAP